MKIYLDIYCYNRQFDKNFSEENFVEFKSVIWLRKKIVQKDFDLVTSFMLHCENYRKKNLDDLKKIDFFIKMQRKIYVGIDSIESLKIFVEDFVSHGLISIKNY